MTERALKTYLTDVLGVRFVLTPPSVLEAQAVKAAPQESPFYIHGQNPQIVLWTPTQPNAEEAVLVDKMMTAAKINSYLSFWGSELSELPLAILENELQCGLKFFGGVDHTEVFNSKIKIIHSSSLTSMLEGPAKEIQANKKRTWGHLQEIQPLLSRE